MPAVDRDRATAYVRAIQMRMTAHGAALAVLLGLVDAPAQRPVEVTVTSRPAGASVVFPPGDVPLGQTPATRVLAPGNHTLRLSLAGYRTKAVPVTVVAATPLRIEAELERMPALVIAANV